MSNVGRLDRDLSTPPKKSPASIECSNETTYAPLRGFCIAVGLTALSMAARGQAPAQVIGFLRSTSAAGYDDIVDAFRKGLADAGLVEGRNVVIDFGAT